MATVTPVTYAEYYRVVMNDPHEGDPSAVYEDKTPVSPIGDVRPTPANIVTAVCGESNPDAYLLRASSCRSQCVHAVEDGHQALRGR